MKKLISIILALVMALSLCVTTTWAAGEDTSWYNDTDVEFVLYDAADLLGLAELVNGGNTFEGETIKLDADINLSGISNWTPIGGLDASKDFKGTLDGNNKTISNLTMTLGDKGATKVRAGLFASLTGTVKNLTLSNVSISANGSDVRAGALGGNIWDGGKVENVVVDGFTFTGSGTLSVGGLAGRFYDSGATGQGKLKDITVKNVNITATGDFCVGGVSGYNSGYFNANNVDASNVTLNVTANEASYVGGFFGGDHLNGAYDFKDCDIIGLNITLAGAEAVRVGGFGGSAEGGMCWATDKNIDTCSAQGTITNNNTNLDSVLGGYYGYVNGGARIFEDTIADVDIISSVGTVGGFVGTTAGWYELLQQYNNCEAKGDVSGKVAGGFIGDGSRATVKDCTASGNVDGAVAGGFVGKVSSQGTGDVNSIAITDSAASGAVSGSEKAGGLIGDSSASTGANAPVKVKNSTGAPTVIGTNSSTTVDKIVNQAAANSNVTLDGASGGTTIKGDNVIVNKNTGTVSAPAGSQVNGTATDTEKVFDMATGQETVEPTPEPAPAPAPSAPDQAPINRQDTTTTVKDTTTDTTESNVVTSAKTFDAGVAVYAVMGVMSLTGSAWVAGKKRV